MYCSHPILYARAAMQGGEDAWDASSCRSFFAKEPLIIGLFCEKWPKKIRHPTGLRHPVIVISYNEFSRSRLLRISTSTSLGRSRPFPQLEIVLKKSKLYLFDLRRTSYSNFACSDEWRNHSWECLTEDAHIIFTHIKKISHPPSLSFFLCLQVLFSLSLHI